MNLGIPQLIYLALTMLGLGIAMAQHGEPKKGTVNAFHSIIATAILIGLLYWGGFFG